MLNFLTASSTIRFLGITGSPAASAPRKAAGLAYSFFLFYAGRMFRPSNEALGGLNKYRPRVWPLAVAEWAIFLTTVP